MTKLIALLGLTLIAAPVFAGPPTGATTSGAGVVATPWRKERPRELPYALTGERTEPKRSEPRTRVLHRLGNYKVQIDEYR